MKCICCKNEIEECECNLEDDCTGCSFCVKHCRCNDNVEITSLNEYQNKAIKTAIYPEEYMVSYPALGLASEVGEVCGKIKKIYRDGKHSESVKEIKAELGDVMWYVAALASDLGLTLKEICTENIKKLSKRKKANTLKGSGDER